MIINGIDLAGLNLDHENEIGGYPDEVPERVAQIDADFLAYQVSAVEVDEDGQERTLETMQHHAREAIHHLRKRAGAGGYTLHLTPKSSNKGGRYEQAILKEYQGNRKDKPKPKHLTAIREWMHVSMGAILHQDKEADDGIAAHHLALSQLGPDKSIVVSGDKDLRMLPGLRLDIPTGAIERSEGDFGKVWIDDTKSTKKLLGHGTKFFWAQLLMGDTADNISGLPLLPGILVNHYKPTKASSEAMAIVRGPDCTEEDKSKARAILAKRKASKVGAVMAHTIIKDWTSDKQCFENIRDMFKLHEEKIGKFKHWQTGEVVPWQKVFISECHLLWMRRNDNPYDFAYWIKEQMA